MKCAVEPEPNYRSLVQNLKLAVNNVKSVGEKFRPTQMHKETFFS